MRVRAAMRSPTGLVLIAFAVGVVVLQTCATLPAFPVAIAMAGACALIWAVAHPPGTPAHAAMRAMLACAAACLLGFGYAAWRAESRLAQELPSAWEGEDIAIVGVVDDLPAVSPQGVRFAFAVERVLTPRAAVPPRISLAWIGRSQFGADAEAVPAIRAGERWRLTVR